MVNLVFVTGVLSRPAQHVELRSGSRIASFEVTVRRPDGAAETAPVVWPDPPAWACALDAGTGVVVIGRIRRRFFRAGGATQSQTEIVAARLVRSTSRQGVAALVRQAVSSLEDAPGSG